MKRFLTSVLLLSLFACFSYACGKGANDPSSPVEEESKPLATRDLERAITLADAALENYFEGSSMQMSRYYNPYTGVKSSEVGSVWMYTSAIEAVAAIMEALELRREAGDSELYERKFAHFSNMLEKLYDGAQYYKGSFTLTSYTGTSLWHPYAVNRATAPETADVTGVQNVYDDQMWLVRELIGAWRVTSNQKYLSEAEALTAYVLDGWDATLDSEGNENGGITWGPGYVTKHSCSNGPMVSPLVWLSEIYSGKSDSITVGIVNADGSRSTRTAPKAEIYLEYARKIYAWQKSHLMTSAGVYDDMMGGYRSGGGKPEYETVDGKQYRKNTPLYDRVGPAISYNSGTMLSGAADLYRATKTNEYLDDLKSLTDKSFSYFAKKGTVKEGLYTYEITGFRNWFNGVLMRGYVDAFSWYGGASEAILSFQNNLDYAWENYLYGNMLPSSLLAGWNIERSRNNVEGMFTFVFAAEYATLAKHLTKNKN